MVNPLKKNLFNWKFLIFSPLSNCDNQNPTFPESPPHSDLTDEIFNDDKRKIHHSDSLYLLRKKVKNENDDNTSDDESQLSSSEQQMVGNV